MKSQTVAELERNAQIAFNLKRLRAQRNLSQRELAEAVGISQSLLAMVEAGIRTLTFPMGISIANVLGCRISEIAGEE